MQGGSIWGQRRGSAAVRRLVVKDGVIVEQGTHEELLEQSGVHRELYETQFKRVLEHEADEK